MKNVFILLLSVFAFISFSHAQVKNISADKFEEKISTLDENEVLLDVRSKKEVRNGHIKGMQNIDWYATDFERQIDLLDKKKTYYVYCAAGGRSMKAAKMMYKKGIKNVYNLNGGITAWRNAKKEIVLKLK